MSDLAEILDGMRISGVEATTDLGGSQFDVLGDFWQAMIGQATDSSVELCGVGHSWCDTDRTFRYLIGAPERRSEVCTEFG